MRQLFVRRAADFESGLPACKVGEILPAPAARLRSPCGELTRQPPPNGGNCRSSALRFRPRRGYMIAKIFVDLSGSFGTVWLGKILSLRGSSSIGDDASSAATRECCPPWRELT